jgi:hypothetical protein
MKDRRERGLCFNCEEKFRRGHHCKKLFLIEGIYLGEDHNDEAEQAVEERNLMAMQIMDEIQQHFPCLALEDKVNRKGTGVLRME